MNTAQATVAARAIENLIREILRDPAGKKPPVGVNYKADLVEALTMIQAPIDPYTSDAEDAAATGVPRIDKLTVRCLDCMTVAVATIESYPDGHTNLLTDERCQCGRKSAVPDPEKAADRGEVTCTRTAKRHAKTKGRS